MPGINKNKENSKQIIFRVKKLWEWRQRSQMCNPPLPSKCSSLDETSPRTPTLRRWHWSWRLKFGGEHVFKKVSLGVGAYRTAEGKPWILPVVKKAEKILAEKVFFAFFICLKVIGKRQNCKITNGHRCLSWLFLLHLIFSKFFCCYKTHKIDMISTFPGGKGRDQSWVPSGSWVRLILGKS